MLLDTSTLRFKPTIHSYEESSLLRKVDNVWTILPVVCTRYTQLDVPVWLLLVQRGRLHPSTRHCVQTNVDSITTVINIIIDPQSIG